MASPRPPVFDHGATSEVTKMTWYFFAIGVVNLPAAFMDTGLAPRATARPTATAAGPSLGSVALPVAGAAMPMAFTACWPRAVRAFAKPTAGVELAGDAVEGGRDAVPAIGARETTSAAWRGTGSGFAFEKEEAAAARAAVGAEV